MARRTNCFVFALYLRCRWKHRGYWALRATRHFRLCGHCIGWHWLYIVPRRFGGAWYVHAEPREPITDSFWKAALHKFYFTPRLRRYDTEWKD
mgnify:FL=1